MIIIIKMKGHIATFTLNTKIKMIQMQINIMKILTKHKVNLIII